MQKVDRKTSEIFQFLLDEALTQHKITIAEFIEHLGYRVYGLGILIFALPSIVPIAVIPGVAALFSVPIFFLSIQLIFAKKIPLFPSWLKNKTINTAHLKKLFHYAIPYLQRIEKLIKPRYLFFSSSIGKVILGILIAWLSILLMLPIPLSNMIFGGLIALLALGLIERDGIILCVGLILGFITVVLYMKVFVLFFNWLIKYF